LGFINWGGLLPAGLPEAYGAPNILVPFAGIRYCSIFPPDNPALPVSFQLKNPHTLGKEPLFYFA